MCRFNSGVGLLQIWLCFSNNDISSFIAMNCWSRIDITGGKHLRMIGRQNLTSVNRFEYVTWIADPVWSLSALQTGCGLFLRYWLWSILVYARQWQGLRYFVHLRNLKVFYGLILSLAGFTVSLYEFTQTIPTLWSTVKGESSSCIATSVDNNRIHGN